MRKPKFLFRLPFSLTAINSEKYKIEELKLDFGDLDGVELLTNGQLKKVMEGVLSDPCPLGAKSCVTTSDCNRDDACQGVLDCCSATLGDNCTWDSTCEVVQSCMDKPVGGGKWCKYNPV